MQTSAKFMLENGFPPETENSSDGFLFLKYKFRTETIRQIKVKIAENLIRELRRVPRFSKWRLVK